ncbi:unnamed protein product [Brassica rapa]|uniref:Uncharacterized protein n=1 Tax=Brassica campestris TaxID=3711 RepID=A0A8D9DF56_BRACM|nr:unnamed protein product [Brassica rapa]
MDRVKSTVGHGLRPIAAWRCRLRLLPLLSLSLLVENSLESPHISLFPYLLPSTLSSA